MISDPSLSDSLPSASPMASGADAANEAAGPAGLSGTPVPVAPPTGEALAEEAEKKAFPALPQVPPFFLPLEPRVAVKQEIYYFDTDAAGVVHNISYLRMIEVARTELAASLGWTLERMSQSGIVPVVHRTEIDYLKPARLGDSFLITAELFLLEKVRFHISFQVASACNENHLFARARQIMVTVQLPSGKPRRIPSDWRKSYSRLCLAGF